MGLEHFVVTASVNLLRYARQKQGQFMEIFSVYDSGERRAK
jgi:hypothetical protein